MKQKDLKEMVKKGLAVDITTAAEWPADLKKEYATFGKNGQNGALYSDKRGRLYAVTARCTNLFAI